MARRRRRFALLLGLLVLAGAAAMLLRRGAHQSGAPQAAADYSNAATWLCRPGRADSCAADLASTAISADGTTIVQTAPPPADPAIDCFYVYPTVSHDPADNAKLAATPEVAEVARVQFARFRGACRTYAPLYRQTTLAALKASAMGYGNGGDAELAYTDVRDAWRSYLAQDNHGRGVVLFGHSQGSHRLKRLIQEEIEGKPAQALLVSALLIGNEVVVPENRDTGGDFRQIPLCRAPAQTGCVVAYSSFRASAPPPPDSRYGHDPGHGMQVACTNPAALGGGAAVLNGYFPARFGGAPSDWADPPVDITTPFVTLPGLISGTCVHDGNGTYLAISFNGHPGDRRRGDIRGDVVVFGHVLRQWGLHVVDVNLTQGDLVRLVVEQGESYAGRK